MPRKYSSLVWQTEYLRLDSVDEKLKIASGQIGAPDAAGKKDIASKQ